MILFYMNSFNNLIELLIKTVLLRVFDIKGWKFYASLLLMLMNYQAQPVLLVYMF